MKNILSFLLLAVFIITACKNQETNSPKLPTNLSQNENKGLQEVIAYYGGEVHFDKGAIPATANTQQKRIFEISLSNSEVLEENARIADLASSNMAWLIFINMGDDASNYDEIHSILTSNDGKKVTTKYPVSDLKIVSKKMNLLNKIIDLIKQDKYEKLKTFLNNKDLVEYRKDDIIKELRSLHLKHGAIKSFKPFGFKRNKTVDGKSILQLSGFIIRERGNDEFSIAVDMKTDKEEVLFIQFIL